MSTRGGTADLTFTQILKKGTAPDGGLYVPTHYPQIADVLEEWRGLSYVEVAWRVLARFMDDVSPEALKRRVRDAYRLFPEDVVPVADIGDGKLLRLSEGPTLSFKDIALQLIGIMLERELAKERGTLNILGATSGDTGSAAEYAVIGRRRMNVFMLSPKGRMSRFQRAQMYTLKRPNIVNIVVDGTFDDCQALVKEVNRDQEFCRQYAIGAMNSINFARIAAQVVYYVYGYLRVSPRPGVPVDFVVPTGNFGNILAGHIARMMGVPIRFLVLATNENDVLREFFHTGVYRPRKKSVPTSSPSMDIEQASNLERFIYDLVAVEFGTGDDRSAMRPKIARRVDALFGELRVKGSFKLPLDLMRVARERFGFRAGRSTHSNRIATIRRIRERSGVVIDPHTADGVYVGQLLGINTAPRVYLETASPLKFNAMMEEALGAPLPLPAQLGKLLKRREHTRSLSLGTTAVARVKRIIADHADAQQK